MSASKDLRSVTAAKNIERLCELQRHMKTIHNLWAKHSELQSGEQEHKKTMIR